jgi:MscS family membrane protein
MIVALDHWRAARRLSAAIALLALLFVLSLGGDARAQASEEAVASPPDEVEAPPEEDFSKPMGPPDPFNRGTPRGSVYGYLTAARGGDYARAAEYLDLRQLPAEEREQGPELARRLKVVLDQTLWVDVVNLADINAGASGDGLAAWQDRIGEIETEGGAVPVLLQRVPREDDGVRIWKISADTVRRVPELYAEFEPAWLEDWLPAFMFELDALDIALWKWMSLALLLCVASIVALLIAGTTMRLIGMLFTRAHGAFDERIVQLVRGPVRLAWTVVLFAAGHRSLGLALGFLDALRFLERLLLLVALIWVFFRLIDLAALALRLRAERRQNVSLLPVLAPTATFAKLLILFLGALGLLGALGVNVTAAVAGLGVGGIAVALAAQRSLENLFGGVSLLADRPVRVGDFFRYGDQVGTVEEIGLRSTRVRTLDRTVVTIPNAEFSNLRLENFARRDRMRLITTIGVRYETTPDQLRFLLARLRRILIAHPRVTDDPARARFVGFGAYSLDIEIFAYVDTSDWSEFLGIREDIYLLFMDAVKEAGTGFAFPSSTTYVGRDEGLNGEDARRAEQRISEWREKGELPFPNYPESFWREEENRLPWPPSGSPEEVDGPPRG